MKYLIISQPKSGTYLCSEIYRLLGINQTYLHLSEKAYTQYVPEQMNQGRRQPEKFTIKEPIKESIKLVGHGDFAVTHSPYTEENRVLFRDFNKVLLVRNMDEIRQSFARWAAATGRPDRFKSGKQFQKKFREIAKWSTQEDVFVMEFDDMRSQNIQVLDQLQMHLFGIVRHDSKSIITQALAANTLTKIEV